MKIQIFSDLHRDVVACEVPALAPGVDCVVVAGDTQEGAVGGIKTLRNTIPMQVPIVMVCGNHEFYRRCLPEELAQAKAEAATQAVHLLENDAVVICGVRFVGASLWTDYGLYGEVHRSAAMTEAFHAMNDHKRITWSKNPWRRFGPREALMLHTRSRTFIEQTLEVPFDGPTYVLSYHAPHFGSLDPVFAKTQDPVSPAYASDLSELIQRFRPDIWNHGHIHSSSDYKIGRTRIICNPHGYGDENPRFDPALVIDL